MQLLRALWHFWTGDGRYCYPLTVADGFSRYLLGCHALASTVVDEAKPVFTRLFKDPIGSKSDTSAPTGALDETAAG